jgi:hypothetical protein
MKLPNETAQKDDLRLLCGLFLLALESDQQDGVEVDGQQRVVDRGGQIALVPPLLAKQLIQADQQANVEYIETGVSTYCHGGVSFEAFCRRPGTNMRYIPDPARCFKQACGKRFCRLP